MASPEKSEAVAAGFGGGVCRRAYGVRARVLLSDTLDLRSGEITR